MSSKSVAQEIRIERPIGSPVPSAPTSIGKRIFDVVISLAILLVASPVLAATLVLVWRQDGYSPFYIAPRVGRGGKLYRMVKIRSMVVNADKTGVSSTAGDDRRITAIGRFVRRFKLDELTQLWNVLRGEMSLVGPRPNVKAETDLYTAEEQRLLSVSPGITDFSSIVFADEGEILHGRSNPDLAYNQLIRPWKSRFGLLYVDNQNRLLDLQLVFLTALALVSRKLVLGQIARLVRNIGASEELCRTALRVEPLVPIPPPGATSIVSSR